MKEKTYSKAIANAIKSYLKEYDWHFSFDEETGMFRFELSLTSKIKKINYIVDVKEDEYIVYAIVPIGADEEDERAMANMAEFICRANYGLKNGNFEFDMCDGEIRYKCYVDCESIIPPKEIVRNSIHCPATMLKHYSSGIVDMLFGNITAKEALEKCEKAVEDEVHSLLRELMESESESEFEETLPKLDEHQNETEEDESSDTGCVPATIKTDLFGTEGDDD